MDQDEIIMLSEETDVCVCGTPFDEESIQDDWD